jgi:hypothetical protein
MAPFDNGLTFYSDTCDNYVVRYEFTHAGTQIRCTSYWSDERGASVGEAEDIMDHHFKVLYQNPNRLFSCYHALQHINILVTEPE